MTNLLVSPGNHYSMNCADAHMRPGFVQNICKQPQVEWFTQDSSCCFSEPALVIFQMTLHGCASPPSHFALSLKIKHLYKQEKKERIELPEAAGVLFLKSGIWAEIASSQYNFLLQCLLTVFPGKNQSIALQLMLGPQKQAWESLLGFCLDFSKTKAHHSRKFLYHISLKAVYLYHGCCGTESRLLCHQQSWKHTVVGRRENGKDMSAQEGRQELHCIAQPC